MALALSVVNIDARVEIAMTVQIELMFGKKKMFIQNERLYNLKFNSNFQTQFTL